jgi:4-amino-4-deoxy-L-arabinose transferase-like glycosyltransferase
MSTQAPPARTAILWLSAAVVAAHLLVVLITPYGFHRDEFLYMAMGRNLRLFAMEFPPMIALLSELQRALFGDSLWSLRLTPALAHGALVVLTALLTARLGGARFAQLLAMTAVATAPLYLRAASLFQPVVFDQLWWTLALYALVRLAAADNGGVPSLKHWALLGVACGVGLLTKFSILIFGVGMLAALLISRRDWLATRGPWIAAAIALLIGSPSWIGQIQLGLPVVAQMGTLRQAQLDRISYPQFLFELVLMHGPGAFLLAATGVVALLGKQAFARWRVVGWTCMITFLIIMGLRGKPYYVGPLFPTLYAAGAVLSTRLILSVNARAFMRTAQIAAVVAVGAWGLLVLPLSLPAFPPEATARFAAAIGITAATTTNQGVVLELPQDYADLLGWEGKVARVAAVYRSLPAQDREQAVIIASNYGQAGAIDFYGPRHGLPEAEAPIGSYWFWGPGEKPGHVIVKVGGDREDLEPFCGSITLADRIDEPWVVPEEQHLAIWICREPYETLQQIWPRFEGHN